MPGLLKHADSSIISFINKLEVDCDCVLCTPLKFTLSQKIKPKDFLKELLCAVKLSGIIRDSDWEFFCKLLISTAGIIIVRDTRG